MYFFFKVLLYLCGRVALFLTCLKLTALQVPSCQTFFKINFKLGMDLSPVLPVSGPFFRDIHGCQIRHFQKAVIRRKNRLAFGHLRRTGKGGKNTGGISEAKIAVSMMKKVWYYERKKFANRKLSSRVGNTSRTIVQ